MGVRARPQQPDIPNASPDAGGPESLAAIDALGAPIVLRDPCGRVVHSNAAARAALGAVDDQILTRIHRSTSHHESSLYLLCDNGKTRCRVQARAQSVPGPDGVSVDLLVISRDDHLDPDPSHHIQLKDAVLAYNWPDAGSRILTLDKHLQSLTDGTRKLTRSSRRIPDATPPSDLAGLAWSSTRVLMAQVIRRIRRHRKGAALRIHHEIPRDDRRTRASEIGLTRIILSAFQILGSSSDTASLHATYVGCRLRIRLSSQSDESHQGPQSVRPDLRRNQALLRELRPLIRALGATLELIHDQSGGSRVHLTVPASERLIADSDDDGSDR